MEPGKCCLSRLGERLEGGVGVGSSPCLLPSCSVDNPTLAGFRGKPHTLRAVTACVVFFFFSPVFKTAVVLVYKDGSKQKKKLVRILLPPWIERISFSIRVSVLLA